MVQEKLQNCIDSLYVCFTECSYSEFACLHEKNAKKLINCIELLSECSTMCLYASKMIECSGEFAIEICDACADLCISCAGECEKHKNLDFCRNCAEVCRQCAANCRKLTTRLVA